MAYANTFRRHEIKFILTAEKEAELLRRISPLMQEDRYSGQTISSLYCDSDDDILIRTSLDKPVYKEKLRLRAYGVPSDGSAVFLEIKKKFEGIVYKRRAELPCREAMEYLGSGIVPQTEGYNNQQVLSEIGWLIGRYGLKPRTTLFYERRAFFSERDHELRLTIDSNVRYRTDRLDPRLGTDGILIAGQPYSVMEIKTASAVPLELTAVLSELGLYQGSFSKYGAVYRERLCAADGNNFIME